MFIDEIPANSKITIEFNYATKATKLDTTVKRVGATGKAGKCIIADVARVDNKIVNINDFRGRISVRYLAPGAKRYELWKQVRVKYDRVNKEYVIISPKTSEKHERRSSQRIPLGLGATVQIEGDARRRNCTIRDISKTGIGIRMEALDFSPIGRGFDITFTDKVEFVSFTIRSRCVREVDRDNSMKIYGCTIRATQDVLAYIQKKRIKYNSTAKSE
ncbi:MAG: PilZ domain-containing protein [Lachnospiraceae bacterium]|nr:PilZ domain-containing protein [Lachnospiraceae bacterium]